jgi:hypothetical protein
LRAFVIMLHPLRQSRTRHTLTTGSKFGVQFTDPQTGSL